MQNNRRQLSLAWRLYAEENRDWLLCAQDGMEGAQYGNRSNWCSGGLSFTSARVNRDITNEAAFAVQCTRADTTQAQLIGFPANYHNGACGFSFSDGHSEIQRWVGSKIRNAKINSTGTMALNVPAGDSWKDVMRMADNATVRR